MLPTRRLAAALLAVSLLVLSACTSSRGGAKGSDTGGLTGAPIVVGFVTQEDSPSGSFPESRLGAEAGVRYANTQLHGVAGRPLQLHTCRTDGSPEGSQRCAQELIAAKPTVVISGLDFGADSSLPQYEQAGIPYVTGSPQLLAELVNQTSIALTGGTPAELLAIGAHLTQTVKAKRITAIYVDLPGLLSTAVQAAGLALRRQGAVPTLISEKADAPDFTPVLTQAEKGKPDAIVVLFPASSCERILRAANGIGVKTPLYLVGACETPSVLRTVGSSQVFFASSYEPVPGSGGSPDVAAYRDAVPPASRTPVSQATFSVTLVVRQLLDQLGPNPTPGQVLDRFHQQKDVPQPMAHSYTCDKKQLLLAPAVCNAFVRILRVDNGALIDATGTWVNGSSLVTGARQ